MKRHLRTCLVCLPAVAALLCAAPAGAQSYPAKPIRFIVPFSPGSGSDTIARIIAAALADNVGQQVIVDNRAGAAGNIGAEVAARAAPDGYSMLLVILGHAANVTLYRNLTYDLVRDFAPVTQLASTPSILVVHPSLPVRSVAELVKLAKAKPGDLNYASGGVGTPTFISGELFKLHAGVNLVHVPYRAGGEALTAVLSGEAPVYFAPVAPALPHVRQGRLRALAVTSATRMPVLPEYPTVAESGYPDYSTGNWYGLALPAKTPADIVAALNKAAVSVVRQPAVAKRLGDLGYVVVADAPDAFASHIRSEIASLAKVLKDVRVE
ncbi:MAG TPA: tripartite tricarboxylate transporter substrate binding protein [Burkholderiales bacterium]|nr:tripartite tricarboxylate transporter substrate binding protein [Burkholderiales bacterium]